MNARRALNNLSHAFCTFINYLGVETFIRYDITNIIQILFHGCATIIGHLLDSQKLFIRKNIIRYNREHHYAKKRDEVQIDHLSKPISSRIMKAFEITVADCRDRCCHQIKRLSIVITIEAISELNRLVALLNLNTMDE